MPTPRTETQCEKRGTVPLTMGDPVQTHLRNEEAGIDCSGVHPEPGEGISLNSEHCGLEVVELIEERSLEGAWSASSLLIPSVVKDECGENEIKEKDISDDFQPPLPLSGDGENDESTRGHLTVTVTVLNEPEHMEILEKPEVGDEILAGPDGAMVAGQFQTASTSDSSVVEPKRRRARKRMYGRHPSTEKQRAQVKKQLQMETVEQREKRLQYLREYQRRRYALNRQQKEEKLECRTEGDPHVVVKGVNKPKRKEIRAKREVGDMVLAGPDGAMLVGGDLQTVSTSDSSVVEPKRRRARKCTLGCEFSVQGKKKLQMEMDKQREKRLQYFREYQRKRRELSRLRKKEELESNARGQPDMSVNGLKEQEHMENLEKAEVGSTNNIVLAGPDGNRLVGEQLQTTLTTDSSVVEPRRRRARKRKRGRRTCYVAWWAKKSKTETVEQREKRLQYLREYQRKKSELNRLRKEEELECKEAQLCEPLCIPVEEVSNAVESLPECDENEIKEKDISDDFQPPLPVPENGESDESVTVSGLKELKHKEVLKNTELGEIVLAGRDGEMLEAGHLQSAVTSDSSVVEPNQRRGRKRKFDHDISAQRKKKLRMETVEQREKRLQNMREYQRRRYALIRLRKKGAEIENEEDLRPPLPVSGNAENIESAKGQPHVTVNGLKETKQKGILKKPEGGDIVLADADGVMLAGGHLQTALTSDSSVVDPKQRRGRKLKFNRDDSAQWKKKLRMETVEQREKRLQKMREYQRRRYALNRQQKKEELKCSAKGHPHVTVNGLKRPKQKGILKKPEGGDIVLAAPDGAMVAQGLLKTASTSDSSVVEPKRRRAWKWKYGRDVSAQWKKKLRMETVEQREKRLQYLREYQRRRYALNRLVKEEKRECASTTDLSVAETKPRRGRKRKPGGDVSSQWKKKLRMETVEQREKRLQYLREYKRRRSALNRLVKEEKLECRTDGDPHVVVKGVNKPKRKEIRAKREVGDMVLAGPDGAMLVGGDLQTASTSDSSVGEPKRRRGRKPKGGRLPTTAKQRAQGKKKLQKKTVEKREKRLQYMREYQRRRYALNRLVKEVNLECRTEGDPHVVVKGVNKPKRKEIRAKREVGDMVLAGRDGAMLVGGDLQTASTSDSSVGEPRRRRGRKPKGGRLPTTAKQRAQGKKKLQKKTVEKREKRLQYMREYQRRRYALNRLVKEVNLECRTEGDPHVVVKGVNKPKRKEIRAKREVGDMVLAGRDGAMLVGGDLQTASTSDSSVGEPRRRRGRKQKGCRLSSTAKQRAQWKKQLQMETVEQREKRLQRMREYQRRRSALNRLVKEENLKCSTEGDPHVIVKGVNKPKRKEIRAKREVGDMLLAGPDGAMLVGGELQTASTKDSSVVEPKGRRGRKRKGARLSSTAKQRAQWKEQLRMETVEQREKRLQYMREYKRRRYALNRLQREENRECRTEGDPHVVVNGVNKPKRKEIRAKREVGDMVLAGPDGAMLVGGDLHTASTSDSSVGEPRRRRGRKPKFGRLPSTAKQRAQGKKQLQMETVEQHEKRLQNMREYKRRRYALNRLQREENRECRTEGDPHVVVKGVNKPKRKEIRAKREVGDMVLAGPDGAMLVGGDLHTASTSDSSVGEPRQRRGRKPKGGRLPSTAKQRAQGKKQLQMETVEQREKRLQNMREYQRRRSALNRLRKEENRECRTEGDPHVVVKGVNKPKRKEIRAKPEVGDMVLAGPDGAMLVGDLQTASTSDSSVVEPKRRRARKRKGGRLSSTAKQRAQGKKQLQMETVEQREKRLQRMREYQRRRSALNRLRKEENLECKDAQLCEPLFIAVEEESYDEECLPEVKEEVVEEPELNSSPLRPATSVAVDPLSFIKEEVVEEAELNSSPLRPATSVALVPLSFVKEEVVEGPELNSSPSWPATSVAVDPLSFVKEEVVEEPELNSSPLRPATSMAVDPLGFEKVETKFSPGDLVFAKVKGYPNWPAQVQYVLLEKQIKYSVYFFGTGERGVCTEKHLFAYAETKGEYGKPRKNVVFQQALNEIQEAASILEQEISSQMERNSDFWMTKQETEYPEISALITIKHEICSEKE